VLEDGNPILVKTDSLSQSMNDSSPLPSQHSLAENNVPETL
jgi:hypothetical protein